MQQFNLLARLSDWSYGIFVFAWLVSGWQGGFWLNVPASPNLVISVVGGIGGSLCLIRFCMALTKRRRPGTPRILKWYGQLSLIVLCVHLLNLTALNADVHVFNWLQSLTGTMIALLVQIICRIAFVTVGLLVVPKIPVLRAGLFPRRYLGR
ncbi:hypothetical protein [Lactiplantibacillus plajomi]|uniref:Integral membrane protein n=1 Tax=Lactiplantibacillus plajomi TaxID=1457217 RepID=A0ABV6K1Q8_9LACO|nr:hypothetical protein [Lactiplantibacillus plajomi]